MKILMVNGSPRRGNTYAALAHMGEVFSACGAEWEIFDLGPSPVRDCVACGRCAELKKCVFDGDKVNELIEKAKTADGFVFGTPVPRGWSSPCSTARFMRARALSPINRLRRSRPSAARDRALR